jgi:methylenetetrahydrofolate dehydrogenase (NADP+) / methenyltetrahydrofolate cyclohydrolase
MAEIDGKQIAQRILDQARDKARRLRIKPTLAVIMVGDNTASAKYVERKSKAAEYVGVICKVFSLPDNISTQDLISQILALQYKTDALIVQLPLPKHIDTRAVLDSVSIKKDADCLSSLAAGQNLQGRAAVLPPTAAAIMEILRAKKITLKGKHVVVVGQGELVGKPVVSMFMSEPVTLTVCGLGTKNLSQFTRLADILISGTGKPGLIKRGMVKKTAVVIDAGSGLVKGKITGDVDPAIYKSVRYYTPVPGGLGPVTVAKLLYNVNILAEQ